jgi:hypothetical protein
MVNNLGGLSFLELGIIADAAVRSLGEPILGGEPSNPLNLKIKKAAEGWGCGSNSRASI